MKVLKLPDARQPSQRDARYISDLNHYRFDYGGQLPAMADEVCLYLVRTALNEPATAIKARLYALSRFHLKQGFPDPTNRPSLKNLYRELVKAKSVQARGTPFEPPTIQCLAHLTHMTYNIYAKNEAKLKTAAGLSRAKLRTARQAALEAVRNKAIMLLSFWFGMSFATTCSLSLNDINLGPKSLAIKERRSRASSRPPLYPFTLQCLPTLCPICSLHTWLELSQIQDGALFREIHNDTIGGMVASQGVSGYYQRLAKRVTPIAFRGAIDWRSGLLALLLDYGWTEEEITASLPQYSRKNIRNTVKRLRTDREANRPALTEKTMTSILSYFKKAPHHPSR